MNFHIVKCHDQGSGTLLTLALMPFVLIGVAFLWVFVDVAGVRQQAAGAADLAALAGAPFVLWSTDKACETATDIARRNAAELTDCWIDESDVVVTVEVAATGFAARLAARFGATLPPVSATARAGPA